MGGSCSSVSGGAWKRLGPAKLTGDTRSPNTGSMSQNLPCSFSRCEEWPSRTMWLALASSASSCAVVSGRTGMASTGTVPTLLLNRKRDQIVQLPAPGGVAGLGGLANRQFCNCGEAA